MAPAISRFVAKYPQVEVQLQLSVTPPPLTDDTFDVCIRFGEPPDTRVIARRLAPNRRLLCAAPAYIASHGMPMTPNDLTRHNCIGIRQGDEAYGVWRLTSGRGASRKTEAVRINGTLTTNDGEIAVNWALEGHGILMRAEWDIKQYLADGRSCGAARLRHAERGYLRGVFAAASDVEPDSRVRRFHRARLAKRSGGVGVKG